MNAPSERLTQVGATMAALRLELDFPRTSFDREGNIVGPPKAVFNNVRLILQNDPYYAGRFSYCDFRAKLMWAPTPGGPMEAFEDHHVDHLRAELASHWRLHLPVAVAYEAARYVARGAPRHAVREYLTGLAPWDGVRRLERLLTGYFGAADTALHREMGARWMVSAIARVMAPPVKVDTVLVLRGSQGCGKSTFAKVLGGAWHRDTPISIGDKDAYLALRGAWIYELGELASTRKKEVEAVKAFISSEVDTVRLPYERMQTELPRQCVFVGTTNEATFLNDPTGARRFWPVQVGTLDRAALIADRDQLWAEALYRYRDAGGAPEAWLLPREVEGALSEAHEEVTTVDPFEEAIDRGYFEGKMLSSFERDGLAMADLFHALRIDPKDQHAGLDARLGNILRARGWSKERRRGAQGRIWRWFPPTDSAPAAQLPATEPSDPW